jgi:hypothetical protein
MRFIHAVREYNLEHRTDIRVIALFSEPDRHARFVREADEAVDLGPSTYVDDADGLRRPAYLDYRALERVLVEAQADAVWTGWGFVAERSSPNLGQPGRGDPVRKRLDAAAGRQDLRETTRRASRHPCDPMGRGAGRHRGGRAGPG